MHVAYNPVLRGMHCHDLSKEYGAPINQLVTHSISQPVDQPIYQSVFTKRLPSAQLLLSAHRVWRWRQVSRKEGLQHHGETESSICWLSANSSIQNQHQTLQCEAGGSGEGRVFRGEQQWGRTVCLEQPVPGVSRVGGESSLPAPGNAQRTPSPAGPATASPLLQAGLSQKGLRGLCPVPPSGRSHVISRCEPWRRGSTTVGFEERWPLRRLSQRINFQVSFQPPTEAVWLTIN